MLGKFWKTKIDDDTIDEFIMYLKENPDMKKRIIKAIFDKEAFVKAIIEIVEKEGNKIHDLFKMIIGSKFGDMEIHFDEVIDKSVKAIDINKKVSVEIDKALQLHPEFKTLKELGKALKESVAANSKIIEFLKQSSLTMLIEHTQGVKK